jgi:uncharacterized RDD family membrane protein YckC
MRVAVTEPAPDPQTKVCPQCTKEVAAAARICGFCRYEFAPLPDDTAPGPTAVPPSAQPASAPSGTPDISVPRSRAELAVELARRTQQWTLPGLLAKFVASTAGLGEISDTEAVMREHGYEPGSPVYEGPGRTNVTYTRRLADGRSQGIPVGWSPVQEQGPAVGVAYASVAPRLGALFVDNVFYLVIVVPIYLLLESVAGMQQDSSEALLLLFGVAFGYFTLSWALNHGQTLGMRVAGVRVVRRKDGGPIGLVRSAVRAVGLFITMSLWFISLVAVLVGREKRSPADALAGTVVIKRVGGGQV